MRFSKISRGFSLVEVLMVLALSAILVSLALPSWQSLHAHASSISLLKQLEAALQFARQQALQRHAVVTICPSADQESCTGRWQQGWIVFLENQQILQAFQATPTHGSLHWRAFPQNRPDYQFLPSGASLHENGSFWYCDSETAQASWAIILSQSGRLRVVYPKQGKQNQPCSYSATIHQH